MRRVLTAALTAILVVLAIAVAPAAAASSAKVVIVVGPAGSSNAHYREDAEAIAVEARRYTPNVVKLITPTATWARVKSAAQGASILVYLGHGNGWPSIYPPFQTLTKNGLGLDPVTGADGTRTVYYGEDYIRNEIRLAPNAVVLLYHLCYASGNTEPGLAVGTVGDARQRVDNYGAGFIGAGARAVFAEGHPAHPATDYVRQLFTTNRTMDQVFRAAPSAKGHVMGPYASQRTPGHRFLMDPDTATPSGFYRSVIGDLGLTAGATVGPLPEPTGTTPMDFAVPGAAEVAGQAGTGLFASVEAAADPARTPASTLATGTRLRLTSGDVTMPDGTRVFGITVLGTATTGFVRANALAPRDSAGPETWSLDQSAPWLSPNADGTSDALVVTARVSEVATTGLLVKNAAGSSVWSGSITGDIVRFAWDLRTSAGTRIPDGVYAWTMRSRDTWGNPVATRTGSFTVDGTAPVTTATTAATAGQGGWLVSAPTVTLAATDPLSGVGTVTWRVDAGAVRTYTGPVAVTADGTRRFDYRAVDRAGVVESWRSLTLRIDTLPPAIGLPLSGIAGAAPGTWRGPVTVAPAITDATSGVGARTIAIDGGGAAPLGSVPVVVTTEGAHTVTVAAADVAGNATSASATFLIDTVAPVLALPAVAPEAPTILTVTPNGDGAGEAVAIPYTISERATIATVVTDAGGATVRTIAATLGAGAGEAAWDGRTAKGVAVPDGRYLVTLTATDPAGNVSASVKTAVDVYAALARVSRTPGIFFPQDGDTLAPRSTATFTLLSTARVSLDIVDTAGALVRRVWTNRELAAGARSWAWNGRTADGSFVPRGTYRFVVRATNGAQMATGTATVVADAFRTTLSTTSPVRGTAFTLTAVTAEPLSRTPTVTVRQPGLPAWSITMTKVNSTTWKATIRPRTGGTAGTMTLTVQARDAGGAVNGRILRLTLR